MLPPNRRCSAIARVIGRSFPLCLMLCASLLLHLFPAAANAQEGMQEPRPIQKLRGAPEWPRDFETGLRAAQMFADQFGVVETDSLLRRINEIGYRIGYATGHPEVLFTFHILDVPEPNAFALPGGFVFVTRGMLDLGLSDSEMAGLLGHESAHVTERHFARSDRVSGVLSLIQTAVLVAALIGVNSSSSGGYDQDPETNRWRASYGGKDAAVQATNVFGSLFRELLVRGYSRGLEMEADEIGRHYASRAGYPIEGSAQMLEALHEHIYEDQEYGYWRTHPYFTDRVARARAAGRGEGATPTDHDIAAYRESISTRLSAIANSIEDQKPAIFIHRSALEADPSGPSSFTVEHRLLQKRAEWVRREKDVLRAYGPLIADYDTLLARADSMPSEKTGGDTVRRIRSEREDLASERDGIEKDSRKIIGRPDAGTPFLELFLENYPQAPDAPAIRYRLAEQYRLADRADDAAIHLNRLVRESWATSGDDSLSMWRSRGVSSLHLVLPQTKELVTVEKILMTTPSDSVKTWAEAQLEAQAASLDSLELGSRFLERYPESRVAGTVTARVEELAMKRYYQGRLYESLHRFQEALDEYNRLLLLAAHTQAATLAREGIDRVQTLAGK